MTTLPRGEYVTAQNLERRALAALGAVTVVPGAVGAWRRSTLEQMGGYPADSLAEAPDTVSGLLKQRFRWSILPWRQASRDPTEWSPDDFLRGVYYWAAFIFVDLSAGALGMAMERRATVAMKHTQRSPGQRPSR